MTTTFVVSGYGHAEKVLETTYHGLIKENETFVELMPQLRVAEGKICGFHIRNTHKGDIPFQVRHCVTIVDTS